MSFSSKAHTIARAIEQRTLPLGPVLPMTSLEVLIHELRYEILVQWPMAQLGFIGSLLQQMGYDDYKRSVTSKVRVTNLTRTRRANASVAPVKPSGSYNAKNAR